MDKLKKYFSTEEGGMSSSSSTTGIPEISIMTGSDDSEDECCPCKMSFTERVKWFAICFGTGCLLSLVGAILAFISLTLFAVFYTLGNLLSLASTCFLMGPCKQLKRMFQETRIIATIVMFAMMALTLMAALWWKIAILAIIFCIFQFLALTWYSLSYIPFARDAVKKCFTSCLH